jgi:CRP-like cAMP-binding protein
MEYIALSNDLPGLHLSGVEYRVLLAMLCRTVDGRVEATQVAMAKWLKISRPTFSRAVRKLTRRGILVRKDLWYCVDPRFGYKVQDVGCFQGEAT